MTDDGRARMRHLGSIFAAIGRLAAIDRALAYDLDDLLQPDGTHEAAGAFARLWHTNMRAWRIANGVGQ